MLRTASKNNYGNNLAAEYVTSGPREKKRTEAQLAAMGYGPDEINARAFEYSLYELTQLERLDAATDARRLAILREIDRHRAWIRGDAPVDGEEVRLTDRVHRLGLKLRREQAAELARRLRRLIGYEKRAAARRLNDSREFLRRKHAV